MGHGRKRAVEGQPSGTTNVAAPRAPSSRPGKGLNISASHEMFHEATANWNTFIGACKHYYTLTRRFEEVAQLIAVRQEALAVGGCEEPCSL